MKGDSIQNYAAALFEATKDAKGAELETILTNFVHVLFKRGQLSQAKNIIEAFVKYSKKQAGVVDIHITSARELDDRTIAHIKKAFGDKVEATASLEPEMIGGIKIRTESSILDGSLRTQLEKLKQQLI